MHELRGTPHEEDRFVCCACHDRGIAGNAAPKKKVAAKQPEMADWQKQNDNSYRFARDSLPIFLPSWAQAVYQYGIKPKMEADREARPAKKKKSKTAAKTN